MGKVKRSLTPASMVRVNANVRPSGEKVGALSPTKCAGGEVILRLSPVSIDTKNSEKGSAA
jgi:hypothetical protein